MIRFMVESDLFYGITHYVPEGDPFHGIVPFADWGDDPFHGITRISSKVVPFHGTGFTYPHI